MKKHNLTKVCVATFAVFACLTGIAVVAGNAAHASSTGDPRVVLLMRACSPIDTGGGVTQCANPTTSDLRLLRLTTRLQRQVVTLQRKIAALREVGRVYLPRVCAIRMYEDVSGTWEHDDLERFMCMDIITSLVTMH